MDVLEILEDCNMSKLIKIKTEDEIKKKYGALIISKKELLAHNFTNGVKIETKYWEMQETVNADNIISNKMEKEISKFFNSWLDDFDMICFNYFLPRWDEKHVKMFLLDEGINVVNYDYGFFYILSKNGSFSDYIYNSSAGMYLMFLIDKSERFNDIKEINNKLITNIMQKSKIIIYENDGIGGTIGLLFKNEKYLEIIEKKYIKYIKNSNIL